MNKLTPIAQDILTASRNDGLVHFPQGTARAVEQTFRILEDLARRGYVQFLNKTGYRAYWLTDKGRRLARVIRTVNNEALPQAALANSRSGFPI